MDDMNGFVAVNNFLLIPLFFLSSALFPLDKVPMAIKIIASFNPISYAVDAIRYTLINQTHFGILTDFWSNVYYSICFHSIWGIPVQENTGIVLSVFAEYVSV